MDDVMTEPAKGAEPQKELELKTPVVKFKNADKRSKVVDLDWPFEIDGILWDRVTVRRVSGAQVDAFVEQIMDDSTPNSDLMPPMVDCPFAVWEGMDDDDRTKVDNAARDFTPSRLRRLLEPSGKADSQTAENT